MEPYQWLVEVHKRIPLFPGWSEPQSGTNVCWFNVALEASGRVLPQFVLHGEHRRDRPDCNVAFELRIPRSPGRSAVPLWRAEWRPLTGGHTNQYRYNTEWGGKRILGDHQHPFSLNWQTDKGKFRGVNLPLAIPISETLATYEEFREWVGDAFRIENMEVVAQPRWEYPLPLWGSQDE